MSLALTKEEMEPTPRSPQPPWTSPMPGWQVWPQAKPWLEQGRANAAFGTMSYTRLSTLSLQLHPPQTLGDIQASKFRGAHTDQCSQDSQASARDTQGFEVPVCPQSVVPQGRPELGGRWSFLGQKCPGLRPPGGSPGSFGDGDTAELPFSGALSNREHKGRHHPPSPVTAVLLTALRPQGASSPCQVPGLGSHPSRPPPAPPGCPGAGSCVQKQFPHAKELGPSRHALLKPHQPSY